MNRICDNVACILLRHAIRAVLFNIRFYFILELQSSATVTKLDRIRNERIGGTMKMGEISKKVQESRLKWYWACYANKRALHVQGDGNGSTRQEERKPQEKMVGQCK